MHDHALTFKADIDIGGTENSLAVHSIVPCTKEYPWSNGIKHSTMKLEKGYVENESEGKINWPSNASKMYFVVNKDKLNPYGEERGYRIMPGLGVSHLTIQESYNLQKSQSFATHHLYVTKHHDSERSAAHALNNYDVYNPIVDFSEYFNDESLVQEDLVLWFNLGMHHVPHTGDNPNTVFRTAQSSMIISPHNYLLRDPSRLSRQQVRINYGPSITGENRTEPSTVEYFGQTPATGTVELPETDLTTYKGDSVVRKWPYDPTNPFDDTDSIS